MCSSPATQQSRAKGRRPEASSRFGGRASRGPFDLQLQAGLGYGGHGVLRSGRARREARSFPSLAFMISRSHGQVHSRYHEITPAATQGNRRACHGSLAAGSGWRCRRFPPATAGPAVQGRGDPAAGRGGAQEAAACVTWSGIRDAVAIWGAVTSKRPVHASPDITLRVYAQLLRKRDDKATDAIHAALASLDKP